MKRSGIMVMCILFGLFCMLPSAFGEVSAQEAQRLKTTLTPMGAEKAGNADSTIPAWDGGYTTVPAGYQSGARRPDPFASEKPLYKIDASNVEQYSARLAEGIKVLLKKHPEYRLDVYPSHRTAAAPQYVYDNTFQNATRAKTINGGLSVEGAYGGIPFPIPKSGNEAMFNHLFGWKGLAFYMPFRTYLIPTSGETVFASEAENWLQFPYYYQDVTMEGWSGFFSLFRQSQTAPAFKAGETILTKDPADMYREGRQAWQYLVGQRRVRRAPSISYDTPNHVTSGNTYWDEAFIFNGALDRYDWKLIGKIEMYTPYNCNGFYLAPKDMDVIGAKYIKPEFVRWELHRMWVVEGVVAQGKRHVVAKRRFYLDEDTWAAIQSDGWDGKGQIWRYTYSLPLIEPEVPCVNGSYGSYILHNLQTGAYVADNMLNEVKVQLQVIPRKPDSFFTPDALAGAGIR